MKRHAFEPLSLSAFAITAAAVLSAGTVHAQTSATWANPSGTNPFQWTTGSNWTVTSGTGSYPNGVDSAATFTNPGLGYTIDLVASSASTITIGSLAASFNANKALEITSGTLNFATSTGTPTLSWSSSVGGPIIVLNNVSITGSQGLVVMGSPNMGTSLRTYSGTNWSGFSGSVALTQGNWDPQTANAAPTNSDLILGGTDATNVANDTHVARFGLFGGKNQTVGALIGGSGSYLSNNSTTSVTTLTIGNNNDSGTFAGNIGKQTNGQPTGSGGDINVVKTGTGTETFSGTDVYTGSTTVNAGTLAITGSIDSKTVTVNSSGTLAGTGSIAGGVTLNGGIINLVDGSTGTLTIGNGLTLSSGQMDFEIGAGGASDLINVTSGSVSATNPITVNITGLSGFGAGTYNLIGGTSSGLGNLALGTTPGGGFGYQLLSSSTGEQLVVTTAAVPEPATFGLVAVGAASLMLVSRRKRLA